MALVVGGLLAPPASAAETTGTWFQYPRGATEYRAEVQQPINTANTSNWSAKSKGGIPIMYELYAGTGPAVFESIGSDSSTANDYAFLGLNPDPEITFADLETLSANYDFTLGNCHGGSIRWEVGLDLDGDGDWDGSLHISYGDAPNFTDCTTNDQSGVNMIGLPDLRYDTTAFAGGTFYDSYAHALALLGTARVAYAELVVDGGWGGDQRATISDVTVNDNVQQWNGGGTDAFTRTCELPDAVIEVTGVDTSPSGPVNETTVYPVSTTDDGNRFRVIDCKYQYVLSIPSLLGRGTYDVEILIDDEVVPTAPNGDVRFDLR
jgi:hypothetical protein